MLDTKIVSLLILIGCGSYIKVVRQLHLTQPAVSHQIKQLEEEFQVRIFHRNKKSLILTPGSEILVKYIRRMTVIYNNIHQALEDARNHLYRFSIATTPTTGEYYIPQLLAAYCCEHSDVYINLITDSINSTCSKPKLHEVNFVVIGGRLTSDKCHSTLLGTDYPCLIVSPRHPLINRGSVSMNRLLEGGFILRSKGAGTREIFESCLESQCNSTRNHRILTETDSLVAIEELVVSNMGVSIMSHNVCRENEQREWLKAIPITNSTMMREINLVYPKDFQRTGVLPELRKTYSKLY